jgi:hypothetical protein
MRNFFTNIPLKNGQKTTPEEFIEFCKGKIARHKIPKYWEFVNGYPMTASGKIQKFKMKEMFEKNILFNDTMNIMSLRGREKTEVISYLIDIIKIATFTAVNSI